LEIEKSMATTERQKNIPAGAQMHADWTSD